jgi:hypothetical protein
LLALSNIDMSVKTYERLALHTGDLVTGVNKDNFGDINFCSLFHHGRVGTDNQLITEVCTTGGLATRHFNVEPD